VKKSIPIGRLRLFERGDGGAIGEKDVEQSVIVVIEDRDTSSHGLERISFWTDAVFEHEFDTRALNDVLKLNDAPAQRRLIPSTRF